MPEEKVMIVGLIEGKYMGDTVEIEIANTPQKSKVYVNGKELSGVKRIVLTIDYDEPTNEVIIYKSETIGVKNVNTKEE